MPNYVQYFGSNIVEGFAESWVEVGAWFSNTQKDHSMIEMRRLKNVAIFIQTNSSFVLSRKNINIYNDIVRKYGNFTVKDFQEICFNIFFTTNHCILKCNYCILKCNFNYLYEIFFLFSRIIIILIFQFIDSYRHLLAKEKNNSKPLHASKILNKQLIHKVDNFLYK